jgi:hypothetical protein
MPAPAAPQSTVAAKDDQHSGMASSDDLGRQLLIRRTECAPGALDQPCLELRCLLLLDAVTCRLPVGEDLMHDLFEGGRRLGGGGAQVGLDAGEGELGADLLEQLAGCAHA